MLNISIIIPAYNEEDHIAKTIESILQQDYPIEQVIVVDDSSMDTTKYVADSYDKVMVITTKKNCGTKAMAQNYALPLVNANITVTVDADTVLAFDAVGKFVAAFDKDSELFSACGFVLPRRIKTIWEKGRYIEYLFGLTINKRIQDEYGAILVCSGCLSAFNTEKLKQYGFRDLSVAEDMDLTWLAHMEGEKIAYVSEAICYPLEPGTLKVYKDQVTRWYSAFFQCLKIHWQDILRFKKPMLSVLIFLGLLEGLFAFPVLGYYLVRYYNFQLLLIVVLLDLFIISIPAIIKGWKIGKLKLTLTSIPCYVFVTRYINLYLFYKSFINEVLLRKTLTTWKKGH